MQKIISTQTKLFVASLFVLLALAFAYQPVSAGGTDPNAGDPAGRTSCGTAGDATANTTIRWTNIYSGPDGATVTALNMPHDTEVTMTGRDVWGCWVRMTSSYGDGWLPIDALANTGVLGLPVVTETGTAGGGSGSIAGDATTNRWTDVYRGPMGSAETFTSVPAGTAVTVNLLSADGFWTHVTTPNGQGWVPSDALN